MLINFTLYVIDDAYVDNFTVVVSPASGVDAVCGNGAWNRTVSSVSVSTDTFMPNLCWGLKAITRLWTLSHIGNHNCCNRSWKSALSTSNGLYIQHPGKDTPQISNFSSTGIKLWFLYFYMTSNTKNFTWPEVVHVYYFLEPSLS